MKRSEFVKIVGGGIGGAVLCGDQLLADEGAAGKPNLLIIQTDEHNFRTLGCYRKTLPSEQAFMWGPKAVVETPHIDSMARDGALCTSFYAASPVCSPSRASFVSGLYPQSTAVVTNDIPMRDEVVTFAAALRDRGYTTGYAGKWHLDGTGKPQWKPKRTFGFTDNRYMFNRGHWKQLELTENGPRVKARKGGKPNYSVHGADKKSFTTDFLTDRTIDFIEKNKEKPFCYMVSIPDPHGPDTVRSPYNRQYAKMRFKKPRTFDKPEEQTPGWAPKDKRAPLNQSQYFGMVKCIDDCVGRMLGALRKHGLEKKTIVVFTADHGDLRGEHHRDNKGVPYDGSAKIPFVIRYPGKIKPGCVLNEALSTVDFAPTILALMGSEAPAQTEGQNAAPLFLTGSKPNQWREIAFLRKASAGHKGKGKGKSCWLCAVTDRHKLIVSSTDDPWLFDLEKDPDELANKAGDPAYRPILQKLARGLQAYGKRYRDPYAGNGKVKADLAAAVKA